MKPVFVEDASDNWSSSQTMDLSVNKTNLGRQDMHFPLLFASLHLLQYTPNLARLIKMVME